MSYAERTRRPPRTLTDREVKAILKVTGAAAAGFRDHVIISLAVGCGLREAEIVGLNIGDVSKDGKRPQRTIQLSVFKRAGYVGDPRLQRVHLPDATYYKLEKFLRVEQLRYPKAWTAGQLARTPLFWSRKGNRLSTRQVREMWRRWQTVAGFGHFYRFHELRHTAITAVRRRTGDIRIAQRFARHVNLQTTVRYEHASDEEVAAAVRDQLA